MENIVVFGAGRMGIRHVQGVINLEFVEKVTIVDILPNALEQSQEVLSKEENFYKCHFILLADLAHEVKYEVGIIASTAGNRLEQFNRLMDLGCKYVLLEKPLGQSLKEVETLIEKVEASEAICSVNFGRRLFDDYKSLKNDFQNIPQLKGPKTISLNTGSIGIGANGIHYLDILFFLLDADRATIKSAEIDTQLIESPRGIDFCDFGGWAVIEYWRNEEMRARLLVSISSQSTTFGSWEFIAPHARIHFSEGDRKRINVYRKEDSNLPMYRYFGDYSAAEESKIEFPTLSEITSKWLIGLRQGKHLLPSISESKKVHQLMFDWLSYSKSHQENFPIT